VIFYGLVDARLQEAVELVGSREEAERVLEDVLADEPDWLGMLSVVEIDFSGADPLVGPV
jgi:hypothetical protein